MQTNPSTNNKEEFECFNQTAAFDSLMRASLAFDAHEESAELIYLKADAIEAMRQEARGRRGVMRPRQAPAAVWKWLLCGVRSELKEFFVTLMGEI